VKQLKRQKLRGCSLKIDVVDVFPKTNGKIFKKRRKENCTYND